MLDRMDYVQYLPAYMIAEKYEEYKATYQKYDTLYKTMKASRYMYSHLTETKYSDKMEYYRQMSLIYKTKAGACKTYGNRHIK